MIRKLIKGVEGKVSEPKKQEEHTPVTTPQASTPPPLRAKHMSIQLRPQDEPTREEETTAPVDDRIIIHAPPRGQQHLMDNEAIALASEPWYHGLMPRGEMSTLLTREGDFLVRKTEVGKTQRFVVSTFWNNRILHILIRLGTNGRWSFSNMEVETISKLIRFYMRAKVELLPEGPKLLFPVCRPKWYILHENLTLKQKLGSGSFGDVYQAELVQSDGKKLEVAVKMLKGKMGKKERAQFVKEASLNRRFKHPNVLRLLGVASQVEPVMVVSELASGGSLRSHCRNNPNLAVHQLTKYLYDAAKGMEYLSESGVVHRDVAARNCLLTSDDQVKISDFGLSVAQTEIKETKLSKVPVRWLAIETLKAGIFSTKSDVWSFGVMMWEVYSYCKADPYPGLTNAEARAAILNGQKLKPPSEQPQFAVDIMEKCWIVEPKDRASFTDIVRALGHGIVDYTSFPQEQSCY
ncbi:hypothetical protein M3Y94_00271000 [Aphelenchoides besseyi]|nr:hypothetical protein M3Y94_00271000 [Aphelenchoides besseyi]KAI6236082.1 Tyrosine-protein kinase [Aphelenchoides besseyi]